MQSSIARLRESGQSLRALLAQWRPGTGQNSVLVSGTARAFAVQAGAAVLGLAVHGLFARLLGASGYGTYGLVLTWVTLLSTVALGGQSEALVRFVPCYVEGGLWSQLRGLQRYVQISVLCASIALSVAMAVVVRVFEPWFGRALSDGLLAGAVLLPLLSLLQLAGALHRSLKRAASANVFNGVVRPAVTGLLGLLCVFVLGQTLTPVLAIALSSAGAVAALVLAVHMLTAAWPVEAVTAGLAFEIRDWSRTGRNLFLMALVGLLLSRIDVLLLGALAPADAVGPYYAAVQIAAIGAYGLNSVNVILAPMIAASYARGEGAELANLTRRAAWLSFVITVLASLGAVALGQWILGLFGARFTQAYVPLLIILLGQIVNAACGPVGYLMTMTRFTHVAPRIFGFGALCNIVLSVLLIPRYGMYGAAVATAGATVVWNLAALTFVLSRLRINPTILGFRSI